MKTSLAILTIVAKNYVAAARVLCRSLLEHNPGVHCYVLFVDGIEGYIRPDDEPFECLSLDQIKISGFDRGFQFKYDITELSTAVKPFAMEYLLREKGISALLYLDPDILVTGSLSPLFEQIEFGQDMVLTPHLDADYPDDGKLPDDGHILISGCCNLGFIGVSNRPPVFQFLQWWQRKLYDHCIIDHAKGYFVDQRFVDLALTLFDGFHIDRDVGYNVAYWNLHSRMVGRTSEGVWTCNDKPLRFFHFSNYKPEKPDAISGHQTRYSFASRPDLKPIFAEYTKRLKDEGYDASRKWPYDWARFNNGRMIFRVSRRAYLQATPSERQAFGDPFQSAALKRLSNWPSLRLEIGLLRRSGLREAIARSFKLLIGRWP